MTIPTLNYDLTGNNIVSAGAQISYDSVLNTTIPAATRPYQLAGTGAPTGLTATKGSTYVNITGATTTSRFYINTDGGTTWANVTWSA